MRYIFTIVLLSLLVSCSTQQEIYVDNPHTLRFGSAGGFTNQTTVFKLLSDGQLFKSDGKGQEAVFVKQLKKSQTKKIFKEVYQLGLDTLAYNHPGNMSEFIQLKTKTTDNKIVWPIDSKEVQTEIVAFYKTLNNYTKPK